MQGSVASLRSLVLMAVLLGAACGGKAADSHKPAVQVAGTGEAGSSGSSGSSAGSGSSGSSGSSAGSGSSGGAGSSAGSGGGGTGGSPVPAGGDHFGADSQNAVMPGTICERLATLQCAGEEKCCTSPGRDFDTCKTTMQDGCATRLFLDKIAEQAKAGFDPARAKTIFTMIESMAKACDAATAAYGESIDGLRSMYQGSVPANATCPTANLVRSMSAAALASCLNPESQACLPDAAGLTWSCKPHGAAGAPCFTDLNCKPGLYCPNPDQVPASGATCTARKAVDASCTAPNECESLFCKGGKCVAADQQAAYCLKQ